MNKFEHAIIKTVSKRDLNMKKNYHVVRKMIRLTHPNFLPSIYKVWDHKIIREEYEIPVRIFTMDEKPRPIIVYFHGGGYVTGDIDSYNRICAHIARITGHVVISVDYRLAPEYKFPTAPEDCYYVTKEIITLCKDWFHVSPEKITLMGDSAGATLAAVVSLMARDRGEFRIKQQILLYPATNYDYTEQSEYPSVRENGKDYFLTAKRMRDYLELYQNNDEDRKNPYFAPILANLYDQPRTLVITAQYDLLRDEGLDYAMRLLECGNEVEHHQIDDALHGFFTLPLMVPAVRETFGYIKQFLKRDMRTE